MSITNEVHDAQVNAHVFSRLNREDTVSETSILQTSLTNMNGYVNINKNDVNNGYVNNDEKMNQLLQSYFFRTKMPIIELKITN